MKPFYFTTHYNVLITIIPDTMAHVDGHPILTYTYSIYQGHSDRKLPARESRQHLDKIIDPEYLGEITFEAPGKMFVYTPNGDHRLDASEIEEVIEFVSEIRENSSKWKLS